MDERCRICAGTRGEHEHLNHEFNLDGQLIPKKKPAPRRPDTVTSFLNFEARFNRLLALMVEKDLLSADEFIWIHSGGSRHQVTEEVTDNARGTSVGAYPPDSEVTGSE